MVTVASKKIFLALAEYNKKVNEELLAILGDLPEEQLHRKTKAFYSSVFGTLYHIFSSDHSWIKRFNSFFQENKSLNSTGFISLDLKSLINDKGFGVKELFRYRKEMDEAISRFIGELDEEKLNSVLKYKNYKGEPVEKDLWKTLLQMFNHQTHHRGSISAMLDMMGVDNDYSTLLTKI